MQITGVNTGYPFPQRKTRDNKEEAFPSFKKELLKEQKTVQDNGQSADQSANSSLTQDLMHNFQGTWPSSLGNPPSSSSTTTVTNGKVPYSDLAKDGIIDYKGVKFVCDYKNNTIGLGDTSDMDKCIKIPLSEGGCLIVNRKELDSLSKAISMFSPEDINRIMSAIAADAKLRKMRLDIEEEKNSIGDTKSAIVTDNQKNTDPSKNSNQEKNSIQGKDNNLGKDSNLAKDEKSLISVVHKKIEDEMTRLKNGEREPVYQIGGQSFTEKEWEKLLNKIDLAIDNAKEQIRTELEQRLENEQKAKEKAKEEAKKKLDKKELDIAIKVDDQKLQNNEDKTDTKIVTRADGSRVLEITMNIGGMVSTMSIKLSEPDELASNQSDKTKEDDVDKTNLSD